MGWSKYVRFLRGAWLLVPLIAIVACDPGEVLSVTILEGDLVLVVGMVQPLIAQVERTGDARRTVSWSVDNPEVASVLKYGKLTHFAEVTALSEGVTRITATSIFDPGKSSTITVTVIPAGEASGLATERGDAAR